MASSLVIAFVFTAFLASSAAHDITKILSQHSDFTSFSQILTQTKIADEINSRQSITVLAVANADLDEVSGRPIEQVENIIRVHVILDYFDGEKLAKLPQKTATLTTLFQATGKATGQTGFLKVEDNDGSIAFGSAVADAGQDVYFVKNIASQPYNISVIQVSGLIVPPTSTGSTPSPSAAPSKKSETTAASPTTTPASAAAAPKKAEEATAPTTASAAAPSKSEAATPPAAAPAKTTRAEAPSKNKAAPVGAPTKSATVTAPVPSTSSNAGPAASPSKSAVSPAISASPSSEASSPSVAATPSGDEDVFGSPSESPLTSVAGAPEGSIADVPVAAGPTAAGPTSDAAEAPEQHKNSAPGRVGAGAAAVALAVAGIAVIF